MVVSYLDVIGVLNNSKIRFVLAGAYGLAGWRKESRATEDVGVIVAKQHSKKATKALTEAFPNLVARDLPVVIRFSDRESDDVIIDVMKPIQQPYCEVFNNTINVVEGKTKYRIPTLEMALAMKFSAMTSLYRADEDKFQDAHDFILMVKANIDIDDARLKEIGSLMYPDGGKDLLDMVNKVRRGEKLFL